MAASLKSHFGAQVKLTPGRSGQFDVLVDGRLVFSKASVGRFPLEGEVEQAVTALKAGKEPPPPPRAAKNSPLSRLFGKLGS
ncbi:MAG: Rdx family protein [Deltaproteobacteria bacterium]|nr:Rdx family protein [Deltaproteobacteria bacterium]